MDEYLDMSNRPVIGSHWSIRRHANRSSALPSRLIWYGLMESSGGRELWTNILWLTCFFSCAWAVPDFAANDRALPMFRNASRDRLPLRRWESMDASLVLLRDAQNPLSTGNLSLSRDRSMQEPLSYVGCVTIIPVFTIPRSVEMGNAHARAFSYSHSFATSGHEQCPRWKMAAA